MGRKTGRKRASLKAKIMKLRDEEGGCCDLCGCPFVDVHRVKPGSWGGRYEELNFSFLCPTHHRAIHFLMKWCQGYWVLGGKNAKAQLRFCMADEALWQFWIEDVRQVVLARMEEQRLGRRAAP